MLGGALHTGLVWIIESVKNNGQDCLTDMLIGDFAVRRFSSLQSFSKLTRLNESEPDLIAINCDDFAPNLQIYSQHLFSFRGTKIVLIGKRSNFLTAALRMLGFEISFVDMVTDSLELSLSIQRLLKKDQCNSKSFSKSLSFNNVILHFDSLEIQILPETAARSITLKEARLLKLFMENPQVCLSRMAISKGVWGNINVSPRTIDSQVSRLRKRLIGAEASIESKYGGGYCLIGI